MDSLLDSLVKFNINRDENEFDSSIDDIIYKLNNQQISDQDYEWDTLCKNYTNICYLDDTIKNYYIPESEKFLIALDKFMYRIDQINLRYINEIEWDTNENVNCKETERLLKLSYFEKDVILKLDYCVQAYKILITIVEIIRKEKYKFKDTHLFETKGFKRRKL
jgi:hypothetical protein